MSQLRLLRIELGQTQETVAERALASGRIRSTFNRTLVARAEAPKPEGLRSHEIRLALAAGLGLHVDDLDAYLEGGLALQEAVSRSSIRPDTQTVARLKAAEAKRGSKAELSSDGPGAKAEKMPNLRAVVDFARRVRLPEAFVRSFERSARRLGDDRPPFEWIDDLRARLGPWTRERGLVSSDSGLVASRPYARDEAAGSNATPAPKGRRTARRRRRA